MTTEPTAILEPSAAESLLNIDSIKEMMDGFDPASLLPELSSIFDFVAAVCRIAVLAGPIILLVLGLAYLLFAPKEANYYFGYRCYFGMGSVEAWRFTQRLAGIVLGALGLVLTIVMLIITNSYNALSPDMMVFSAVKCLLWQFGLIALSCLGIHVTAAVMFDRFGNRRKNKGKEKV